MILIVPIKGISKNLHEILSNDYIVRIYRNIRSYWLL